MKRVIGALTVLVLWGSSYPVSAYENNAIQGLHQDIISEMEESEAGYMPHLQLLWQHAIQRNPTLQLAFQKLAEKTGQVAPQEKAHWTQGMLGNMIQLGGMGSALALGNPAPIIGSSVVSRVATPDRAATRLTQVTSADLVILSREIEDAQGLLLFQYFQYRQALEEQQRLQMTLNQLQNRSRRLPQDQPGITDTYLVLVVNQAQKLKQADEKVKTYRNLLVHATGETAVDELDRQLKQQMHAQQMKQ